MAALPPQAEGGQRTYIRVPTTMPGKVLVNKALFGKVTVHDLSTGGASFTVEDAGHLPNVFELEFQLPRMHKTITAEVDVRSRTQAGRRTRIGVRFAKIDEASVNAITAYITRFISFSLPCLLLNSGVLLLCIDSLWRISAYVISYYFVSTPLGKSTGIQPTSLLYAVVLLVYFFVCAAAFGFTSNIRNKGFILGVLCLIPAFAFLLAKNLTYLMLWLGQTHEPWIHGFFIAQWILVVYTGMTILGGFKFLFRRKTIITILDAHQGGMQQRKE